VVLGVNRWVDSKLDLEVKPRGDVLRVSPRDSRGMALSDYLINVVFVVVVLRQARERRLDARSVIAPLALVVFVATHYVHTIPASGDDLELVAVLTGVGVALGVLCGYATHVRADADGARFARVGWVAGGLLVAGIGTRIVFVFALTHGAGPAIRAFSIVHHIGASAWPVALVAMALCEVTGRIVVVQVRSARLASQDRRAVSVTPA
jgi:hypothetical protein